MNPRDYRREYAAYCSAIERGRFDLHAGLAPDPPFERIEDAHAHLWTREAFEGLRRAREETPAHFETERAGLHALAGAAGLKFIERRTGELTAELSRCAAASRVEWDGETVEAEGVPDLIGSEPDAARRRRLAERWLDAVSACDDLRASRLEASDEAARTLGFESYRAFSESVTGAGAERLAAGAGDFLERTADPYLSHLARWAARSVPPDAAKSLEYTDALFFERAARFGDLFPPRDVRAAYGGAMSGLGIQVEKQTNVRVDDAARPLKRRRAACFAVEPPDDVRLVVNPRQPGGVNFFRDFFGEAGRAQHFGWASRDTAARHPEFVHAPDAAAREGAALLFAGLFRDAGWLGAGPGLRATEAGEVARAVALLELYEARRACAGVRYWLALCAAADARSEQLDEAYAASHTEATGFRHRGATRWLDAEDAARAAGFLRARLFAAGLREHLRARHGRRWYGSRAAVDELIDVWNTASRYAVEELARLVWGGVLDFELLADELLAALNG